MSALSVPPSHRTSVSVHLESVHSYANILNPIAVVAAEQYSVVAIYTETEGPRLDPDMMETAEVQLQTDFYEEEIVAASVDGRVEANGFRSEEPREAVGVVKASETLTKAVAGTGKINYGSENGLDQEDETAQQSETQGENVGEKRVEESPEGDPEKPADAGAAPEHNPVAGSVPEEQQSLCSGDEQPPTHLQKRTNRSSLAETTNDPETYEPSTPAYGNY